MKLTTIIRTAGAISALAISVAPAATLVSWSAEGGAWNPINQPDYNSGDGGVLNSDQSIARASISAGLSISAFPPPFWNPSAPPPPGIYTDFFYDGGNQGIQFSFTYTVEEALDGLQFIVIAGGGSGAVEGQVLLEDSVTIAINGTLQEELGYQMIPEYIPTDSNSEQPDYNTGFIWSVDGFPLAQGDTVSVTMSNPYTHTAYDTMKLVPEPSSILLGGVGMLILLFRRR